MARVTRQMSSSGTNTLHSNTFTALRVFLQVTTHHIATLLPVGDRDENVMCGVAENVVWNEALVYLFMMYFLSGYEATVISYQRKTVMKTCSK